jgi:succinoglycan biosynthesis protein ExoH
VGFDIGTANTSAELHTRANADEPPRKDSAEVAFEHTSARPQPAREAALEPRSPLERIDALRIALIGAILVLHAKPLVEQGGSLTLSKLLGGLIQEGPLRAAVPLLSAVSGYLLFRSRLDQKPAALLRKKTQTLLLPLVMWNAPLALVTWWAQAHGKLLEQRLVLGGPGATVGAWLDALLGVTSNPIDFPLHFIRDLYVLCVLALAVGPLLRRSPIATFFGVHVVFVLFDWDGDLVRRIEMASMFFGGAALAVTRANLRVFDAAWRPLLVVFALTSLAVVIDGDRTKLGFLRILGVISLWPTFGALMETRAGQWLADRSYYSFWLYASHGPLLELLHKVWRPAALGVADEWFWLLGPIGAIAISIAAFHVCAAIAPKFTALATGGRITPPRRDVAAASQ